MTTCTMSVVFIFVPLSLMAFTGTVTTLHSPTNVRAESFNGSSTIIVKWSNQEDVSYYKAAIKFVSLFSHESSFLLSDDNTTRMACFKTMGGRCPSNTKGSVMVGPGQQWTYGSEVLIQAGACSTNESESCLMSSWVKFVMPLGVPDSVHSLTAAAAPGLGIDVSWIPPVEPRGAITKYIVSYKTEKDDVTKTKQSDGFKTYITITGLEPATKYTVWVTAYNARYKGKKSENVTAVTFSDACSPSPCQHHSACSSVDLKPTCNCEGVWKGTFCSEPKGYSVDLGKCFPSAAEHNHRYYKYYNVSLASCKSECAWLTHGNDKSCSSFVYMLGYSGNVYSGELRRNGIGSCYLSKDANVTLVPCSGDFYKVAPEPHSAAVSLSYGLVSLFVCFFLSIVRGTSVIFC